MRSIYTNHSIYKKDTTSTKISFYLVYHELFLDGHVRATSYAREKLKIIRNYGIVSNIYNQP